jgi:hypothetical protein
LGIENHANKRGFFILALNAKGAIILMKALSDRALKKFNPKPLKTSTLIIILVVIVVLMIISWVSFGK